DQLRAFVTPYNVNAAVRYGGIAGLKETAYENKMKKLNNQVRDKTKKELTAMGYEVIPYPNNFFMVNVKKDVNNMADGFSKKGILGGRKFSPMNHWLRVSVGTEDEMNRFTKTFKELLGT